jgi:hypothetical protein
MHVPFWQTTAQVLPQEPQFVGLDCRFTHCVPHGVSPVWHPHVPLMQACAVDERPPSGSVPAQALPQLPQLLRSELGCTHCEPHNVYPVPQEQLPLTQVWVPTHALPQLPQLFLSVCKFAQTPVAPVPQGVQPVPPQLQAPFLQVSGRVHALPQSPQLSASVITLAQMPGPQFLPVVQPHAPLMHTWGAVQRTPQSPQLFESVSGLTHCVLLQTNGPAAFVQSGPHFPSRQTGMLAPQGLPQPLQAIESVRMLRQIPAQSRQGSMPHWQTPSMHPKASPQSLSQTPQL